MEEVWLLCLGRGNSSGKLAAGCACAGEQSGCEQLGKQWDWVN